MPRKPSVLILIVSLSLTPLSVASTSDPSEPVKNCYRELRNDKNFFEIQKKVALMEQEQTEQMIQFKTKPTAQERKTLKTFLSRLEDCERATYDVSLTIGLRLDLMPFYLTYENRRRGLYRSLQSGELSYGEFAEQRASAYKLFTLQLQGLAQRVSEEEAKQAAIAEAKQREAERVREAQQRERQAAQQEQLNREARQRAMMEEQLARQREFEADLARRAEQQRAAVVAMCLSACMAEASGPSRMPIGIGQIMGSCNARCYR